MNPPDEFILSLVFLAPLTVLAWGALILVLCGSTDKQKVKRRHLRIVK